jgi:iron complex transport system ATP-binding protein
VAAPEAGLTVQGVTAGYGRGDVLHEASLGARPGEVVGLIGPNGSGKTTLVRVASRGLRPSTGRVLLNGVDPYSVPNRRAAQLVAVVPQELAPVFTFTVIEVVLMGRSPYLSSWSGGGPDDWEAARQAMAAANVQHLADRPLDELSGGERQRAVLAQTLAQQTPILLLDEPTTHLDPRHVLDAMQVMRRLAGERGATILAVFHDLNLASAFCDRIHVLLDGRVVASGPPEAVIRRDLLHDVYGVDVDVRAMPATGRPAVILTPTPSVQAGRLLRAHVIGGAGSAAAVLRGLVALRFDLTVGVLHSGDTDDEVAERLGLRRVTVPAFAPIDQRAAAECLALARACDVLIVCDPPVGPGNLANLRLAALMVGEGIPTAVLERSPMPTRDFTGGEATRLWDLVVRGASTVSTSPEDLLERFATRAGPRADGHEDRALHDDAHP